MSNEDTNAAVEKVVHPTAKAFFDALDSRSSSKKQSEKLKRRSQSLGWRNRHSQAEYYPLAVDDIDFSVQQVQRGELEGTYGTGATVWPAAMILIKYLEKNPFLIHDKTVVDLGSGTGVTSIAAAILGAKNVVCTDGEESVVRLAKDNIVHACQEITEAQPTISLFEKIAAEKYWWGDGTSFDDCDVILVADCVLPKLYPIAPLVQAIDELLSSSHSVAILSYEYRYYPEYDPAEKFRELANERNLEVHVISHHLMDQVYCVDDIEIWHVKRKHNSKVGE